jgi:DNA-binding NarL/FixJ family response regulator
MRALGRAARLLDMQPSRETQDSSPLRVLIVDEHQIFRGACAALLRTEGLEAAGIAPTDDLISLVRLARPHMVLIDSAAHAAIRELVGQLRSTARPPVVIVVSSDGQDECHADVLGLPFIAKADICAGSIAEAIEVASDQPAVRFTH